MKRDYQEIKKFTKDMEIMVRQQEGKEFCCLFFVRIMNCFIYEDL